jgi:phospholipase/carboxylesterase
VVPARGLAALDQLKALGYNVQWHDYPMPHSVCPQEIADINAWLLQVLAPKAA